MYNPNFHLNHLPSLLFTMLLLMGTAQSQYFVLVAGIGSNQQHATCSFSSSNSIAISYVSDTIGTDYVNFRVLANDLQSTEVEQLPLSTASTPRRAIVDSHSEGYMVAAMEDTDLNVYFLDEDGAEDGAKVEVATSIGASNYPSFLTLDEESFVYCVPTGSSNGAECEFVYKNSTKTSILTVNSDISKIDLALDPLIDGAYYVLIGVSDGDFYQNELYHFTQEEEDWIDSISTVCSDTTNQSIAVLNSGNIVMFYHITGEETRFIIRGSGETQNIIDEDQFADSDDTFPTVRALSDGGFVVLYSASGSVYYQLYNSAGAKFGPGTLAIESGDPNPDTTSICTSEDEFEFAVIYSLVDGPTTYKIAKHPVADSTPLTYTLTCSPNAIVFSHGGNDIDQIYVKKFTGESYDVITPTMTGTDEVTLAEDDFDYEAEVEYVIFDATNGYYTSVTIDHTKLEFLENLGDDSCGCFGEQLKDIDEGVCAEIRDLEDLSLIATIGDDMSVDLVLTLDTIEENNFFNEVTWTVTSAEDTTDLEAFLATQTDLEIAIEAELFALGSQYTFTATTDQDRSGEVSFTYSKTVEEEDGFIVYNTATNRQFSYRLLQQNGQPASLDSEADSIQFRFVFPSDHIYAQTCFAYGNTEDNVQNYECYGVRKVSGEFEIVSLDCPRNVNTGAGVCTPSSVTISLISTSIVSTISQGSNRILQEEQYNRVVIQRDISESSSKIQTFPVGESTTSFSFSYPEYELDLDEIDDKSNPQSVVVTVEGNDSLLDSYDFTDSAAPIAMLIIGILFIAITALATKISKNLSNYSSVNSLEAKSGKIKTAFIMFVTNHPLFGVYLFKSPTISKFEASILYCSRAFAVMLFANTYNMVEFDTPRFLYSTENSEFTAGFLLLPYVTYLPAILILGVMLRGRLSTKQEPSYVTKIFTILLTCILILLAFIFTVLIQKNMTEDQRIKANKSFGQAMFQDLIVTPILSLILYGILYRLFFKKQNGEVMTSKVGYVLVAESVQECMKQKQGLIKKDRSKKQDEDEKKDLTPFPATQQSFRKDEDEQLHDRKEVAAEKEKGKIEPKKEEATPSLSAVEDDLSNVDEGNIHIPDSKLKKQTDF